jgi:formiminotetrahydrofolate cyclodeaminase
LRDGHRDGVRITTMTLADATVAELLEQLAAATPAPAGGTAAALAGAAAAALTEMAAAFALARGPKQDDESVAALHNRAGVLRAQLLALADADAVAYRPVLDALALARDDERRAPALRAALSAAAEVPLAIAEAAAEVADLAVTIMWEPGNRLLFGDASAALTIAEAATGAAAALVELNLDATPDDSRRAQATKLSCRTAELRAVQRVNRVT